MRAIARRIRTIERKLYMDKDGQGRLIILRPEGEKLPLPEPLEEWITYKQAIADCWPVGILVPDAAEELEARKRLQNPER